MKENKVYVVSYINNVNGQMTQNITLYADLNKAQKAFEYIWHNNVPLIMNRLDLVLHCSPDNKVVLTDKFNHNDVVSLALFENEIK